MNVCTVCMYVCMYICMFICKDMHVLNVLINKYRIITSHVIIFESCCVINADTIAETIAVTLQYVVYEVYVDDDG